MPFSKNVRFTIGNGTTVAWSELGEGPPLVLLHGLGDSHRTWRAVAPALARRFRVLAPDLPGHGLSARPDAPYTLGWYADTIAAWLDAIGVERAHFGGHSYGGGIAQWMLLHHAHRIDRLALIAAGGLGREVGAALRLAALPVAAPFLAPGVLGPATRFLMPRASRSFASRGAKEIERLARLNGVVNTGLAFRRTVAGCIDVHGQYVQTWQHIESIGSLPPMAVFWGEDDSVIPAAHALEVTRRLANVSVSIYAGSGHFVHLEQAAQVAWDLSLFLLDPDRAPARVREPSGHAGVARAA